MWNSILVKIQNVEYSIPSTITCPALTIKTLYDFTKDEFGQNTDTLPELVIQDFDDEQIWQQLELQNEIELPNLQKEVSQILLSTELTLKKSSEPDKDADDESGIESAVEATGMDDGDEEISDSDDNDDDDDMDLDMDYDGISKKREVNSQKSLKKPSIVDDKFFKLEELDEYLTKEEKKIDSVESEASDEESVDLFEDHGEEEDEDSGEETARYADFFDSPHSADEDDASHNNSITKKRKHEDSTEQNKRVKFNLDNDSDDSIRNTHKAPDEQSNEGKSTLEKRQERLQMRIKEHESQLISEKPWQLRGEVTANNRPQNSLLEEFVEFDIGSRPAPVITEKTTLKLEDIIKQRIKDRAWDDVEKKFKPVLTPKEYKKKLVMDQEKSQKSLSEIYAEEYMKKKEALNTDASERQEEEPKEHKAIRVLMHALFIKLDALSNYHYTPKPAKPEVMIVENVAATTKEEVAPIATSDAALLAPEEVYPKRRGDLIGKSERTHTDMKRARRKKKVHQREKKIASEKKEKSLAENLKPQSKKKTKSEDTAMVKKLIKDRNISKIDETTKKAPRSSTAFFAQLQDEITSTIKKKGNNQSSKKRKL